MLYSVRKHILAVVLSFKAIVVLYRMDYAGRMLILIIKVESNQLINGAARKGIGVERIITVGNVWTIKIL